MKKLSFIIPLVVIVLGVSTVYGWQGPQSAPPDGNVKEPLNQGDADQTKGGNLIVNGADKVIGLYVHGVGVDRGKVGIGVSPQYKLDVDGTVRARAFFYASDARMKENVAQLQNSLNNVLKLRGVSFTMKDSGARSVGLIAQEVEKVYPDLVKTDKFGLKSVEYGNLVAPLIEAVKAQQAEIEALKARIAELEARK